MTDTNNAQSDVTTGSYVDSYAPPTPPANPAPAQDEPVGEAPTPPPQDPQNSGMGSVSQALEDQNIFFLLGITDGTDEEREAFLDELQQVIWEDFLENDVELLITEEEMEELKKVMADKSGSEADLQEKIITYLEKLIPDLEEIMLEKALELKEDMVRERITGMREYYVDQAEALQSLDQAEQLINDDQWREAAEVLNSLS